MQDKWDVLMNVAACECVRFSAVAENLTHSISAYFFIYKLDVLKNFEPAMKKAGDYSTGFSVVNN